MNGREILVDTNIFLYLLKGNDTLEKMLQGKQIYISFITELELIGFKNLSLKEEKEIALIVDESLVVSLNNEIKKTYIEIRKKSFLKLADAIIAATAIALEVPLISADKQFKTIEGLDLVSYEI